MQFYNWFRHHCTKPYTNCRPPREEPHRGGEWSSENEKSRQILPKSRNLAQATHGSRSLRFCVCRSHICFSIKLLHFFDSGSDFKMPVSASLRFTIRHPYFVKANCIQLEPTLGTRGNSLAKSGRPKAGETSVRSEASEGPNASSLWWRTPTVSL